MSAKKSPKVMGKGGGPREALDVNLISACRCRGRGDESRQLPALLLQRLPDGVALLANQLPLQQLSLLAAAAVPRQQVATTIIRVAAEREPILQTLEARTEQRQQVAFHPGRQVIGESGQQTAAAVAGAVVDIISKAVPVPV